jgi:hypothetical protein
MARPSSPETLYGGGNVGRSAYATCKLPFFILGISVRTCEAQSCSPFASSALALSTFGGDLSKRAVAWVERSCAEQGVPVKMTDPLVLAEVAEILCSLREKRDRQAEPVMRSHP